MKTCVTHKDFNSNRSNDGQYEQKRRCDLFLEHWHAWHATSRPGTGCSIPSATPVSKIDRGVSVTGIYLHKQCAKKHLMQNICRIYQTRSLVINISNKAGYILIKQFISYVFLLQLMVIK